jgi:hypothetical protein
MRDHNAEQLLAKVMGWRDPESVSKYLPTLQLLADYKYDRYQQFGPGKRFIESLALWLQQLRPPDRATALDFVLERLIFFSDAEFAHLVHTAYPDVISQERLRLVAEERDIPSHRVAAIAKHRRSKELQLKSLYLGLSDGARTNELRRAAYGEIGNEQIWHAYELGDDKVGDMLGELRDSLKKSNLPDEKARFNLIWLLDDFSGSGNTYIRYDAEKNLFKGKLKKIYERLGHGDLVDPAHYEVFLLLYVATRKAIDHIEYWAERFTSERGFKPLQVRVLFPLEHDVAVSQSWSDDLKALLTDASYYDERASDKHIAVGGTQSAQLGFAECALPVVLSHNTPNNSVYLLWGPAMFNTFGLFPRVSRHREF